MGQIRYSHLRTISNMKRYLQHNSQSVSSIMLKALAHNGGTLFRDKYDKKKHEISINTSFVPSAMVPEFSLHVITPEMEVWKQPFDKLPKKVRDAFDANHDPYWAIFWPGGQALCRYIIDLPTVVKNKRVVDLGAGSGALSFASILSGCENVLANDIDDMSINAILLNAEKNDLISINKLQVSNKNFLEGNLANNAKELADQSDVLLVGDMFFDEDIGDRISTLVSNYISLSRESSPVKQQKVVLIGDPGRWYLRDNNKKNLSQLRCIAKYELTDELKANNYGLTQGFIYEVTV